MKGIVTTLVAGAVALGVSGTAGAWGESEPVPLRAQVAELLASPKVPNVDVQATSMDAAMKLIDLVVETYLRETAGRLGGDEAQRLAWAQEVILGFGESPLRHEYRTLLGDRQLVVNEPDDAVALGAMFADLAALVGKVAEAAGGAPAVRLVTRRILADVVVDSGAAQPMVEQIRVQLRRLAAERPRRLRDYFVAARS
ncbi:MAG: hypothetical protein D6738_09115 [Acidobacteria bacterium]|nr:MAG: hypothetical protein D6738_09115 [Acidobacteriota bacterium]